MTEVKRSLNEILGEMQSLQNLEEEPTILPKDEGEVIYDEFITHDMAKIILGNKYNPKCQYKIITQCHVTVLCKINPDWPEDRPPVTDVTGRIIDGAMVEYVLDEEKQEGVQSYTDMMLDIDRSKLNPTVTTRYYGFNEKPKRRILLRVFICFTLIVIASWIAAFIFLSTLKGGF